MLQIMRSSEGWGLSSSFVATGGMRGGCEQGVVAHTLDPTTAETGRSVSVLYLYGSSGLNLCYHHTDSKNWHIEQS